MAQGGLVSLLCSANVMGGLADSATATPQPGQLGSGSCGLGDVDNLLFARFGGARTSVAMGGPTADVEVGGINVNGLDFESDNYNGSRRTVTLGKTRTKGHSRR